MPAGLETIVLAGLTAFGAGHGISTLRKYWIIHAVATNNATYKEIVWFEHALRDDTDFHLSAKSCLDHYENWNYLCGCCRPRDTSATKRLTEAIRRVTVLKQSLPPHGKPLLPGDKPPRQCDLSPLDQSPDEMRHILTDPVKAQSHFAQMLAMALVQEFNTRFEMIARRNIAKEIESGQVPSAMFSLDSAPTVAHDPQDRDDELLELAVDVLVRHFGQSRDKIYPKLDATYKELKGRLHEVAEEQPTLSAAWTGSTVSFIPGQRVTGSDFIRAREEAQNRRPPNPNAVERQQLGSGRGSSRPGTPRSSNVAPPVDTDSSHGLPEIRPANDGQRNRARGPVRGQPSRQPVADRPGHNQYTPPPTCPRPPGAARQVGAAGAEQPRVGGAASVVTTPGNTALLTDDSLGVYNHGSPKVKTWVERHARTDPPIPPPSRR